MVLWISIRSAFLVTDKLIMFFRLSAVWNWWFRNYLYPKNLLNFLSVVMENSISLSLRLSANLSEPFVMTTYSPVINRSVMRIIYILTFQDDLGTRLYGNTLSFITNNCIGSETLVLYPIRKDWLSEQYAQGSGSGYNSGCLTLKIQILVVLALRLSSVLWPPK